MTDRKNPDPFVRRGALAEALVNVPDPPCNGCPNVQQCAKGMSCRLFSMYIVGDAKEVGLRHWRTRATRCGRKGMTWDTWLDETPADRTPNRRRWVDLSVEPELRGVCAQQQKAYVG